MQERLFDHIEKYSGMLLLPAEKEVLQHVWKPYRVRKKQYLLAAGEVCLCANFIIKRALRQHTVEGEGNEHIKTLAVENWWLIDRNSYFNRVPSQTYIDAWEPTNVIRLHRDKLDTISETPAVKEMFWQMNQRNQIASEKRLMNLSSLTAPKRFESLAENQPWLLERFPQHLIASFLGITKETLSRLRSALARD